MSRAIALRSSESGCIWIPGPPLRGVPE